ncbi:hypothetical protein [Nannocystis punicea]|uniref:Lipoprotein n=1 Tax=Nannocystis punicea TaxID=2995304 RepID=A0ABY7H6V1_9BACT|nr:hypothetical protein [Nannocystis poenicansa]WAS95009.1 hypothetical protein O0S08_02510 [Nannocystis poenicansa]
MARPRLVAALALLLAGGCIQFEHGPTTDGPGQAGTTTGEDEEPPPVVDCDPLSQDCPDGQACSLVGGDFSCIEVFVDGGLGDPCQAAGECSPGLVCLPAGALGGCDGSSCCSPLCDVSDTGAQCGSASEVCAPVLTGDDVPPMYADYGVCRLP